MFFISRDQHNRLIPSSSVKGLTQHLSDDQWKALFTEMGFDLCIGSCFSHKNDPKLLLLFVYKPLSLYVLNDCNEPIRFSLEPQQHAQEMISSLLNTIRESYT